MDHMGLTISPGRPPLHPGGVPAADASMRDGAEGLQRS